MSLSTKQQLMYFKDIIGQDELKARLIRSANIGFVPHSQIFTEKGGTGAFPLALAYARYLNCLDRKDNDSCGHCSSCIKFDQLAHPDLHFVFPIVQKKDKKKEICDDYLPEWRCFLKENIYFGLNEWMEYIDAGNSQPIIYARESDEIMHKVSLRISEAKYRILMIWLPEKLHPSCANKLLKLIEEPPANTIILMVSEIPDLVLGTIISRSQMINVPPLKEESLKSTLMSKYMLSENDAEYIAHLSQGSYLKATELISTNEENMFYLEQFKTIMRNSWARNVKGMKEQAEMLATIGREKQKNFLAYCQHLIRENFIYRFQAPEMNYLNMEEASFSVKFSPFVNERNVFGLMEELEKAEMHITQNVNAKIVLFDLALKITVLIRK